MENRTETERNHKVILENRSLIKITDVEDVASFDETRVILLTSMGEMVLTGDGFRINKLNVDDGEVMIEGDFDAIEYTEREKTEHGGGLFGRIFR